MFHVFALVYLITGFLWLTPQFCKPPMRECIVTQARACTVTRACTLSLCMRGISMFAFKFFKLFTDRRSKVVHEKCSSSWLCDRNLNLCHTNAFFINAQNFKHTPSKKFCMWSIFKHWFNPVPTAPIIMLVDLQMVTQKQQAKHTLC